MRSLSWPSFASPTRGAHAARLQQLRSELMAVWSEDAFSTAPTSVQKLLAAGEKPVAAPLMVAAQIELIRKLSPEALRLKHAGLKEEFIALAGPAAAASYLSRLSDPTGCSDEQVRAEVIELAANNQKLRTMRDGFNLVRTAVALLATLLAILFSILIVAYFLAATRNEQNWTPFATTMLVLSGMLGACVSALSRLYSIQWTAELASGVDNYSHLFWTLILNFVLAVLEGGIFAVLLYLAFMGKFVGGTLFPAFKPEPAADLGHFHRFFEAGLVSHADYAKAVVWGFLAGFSERLVPDFLGSLGSKLEVKKG